MFQLSPVPSSISMDMICTKTGMVDAGPVVFCDNVKTCRSFRFTGNHSSVNISPFEGPLTIVASDMIKPRKTLLDEE